MVVILLFFVNNPTPTLMRYDNVEQQIPCRILNRRLLNRSDGIRLLNRRLLIRSDGIHGPVASSFSIYSVVFSTVVMVFTVLVVVISFSLLRERTRSAVTCFVVLILFVILLSPETVHSVVSSLVLVSTRGMNASGVCLGRLAVEGGLSALVSTVGWSTTGIASGNTVSPSTTDGCSDIAQHCGLES